MTAKRPTISIVADFDSGPADLGNPFARASSPIVIQRGTTQLVTTGFVAEQGYCTATVNNRGRELDPLNLSGPYVTLGVSDVVPGVQCTVTAELDAITYPLLVGTADDWQQENPSTKDAVVPLRISDGQADFSRANFPTRRPSERSGSRIQEISGYAGWSGPIAIAAGNCRIGPLEYGQANAWTHMTSVAMAEWGDLYIAANGTLTFRSRDQIASEARSITPQAVYSDSPGVGEFAYTSVKRATLPIVNDATISFDAKGNQRNAQDATSIAAKWKLRHQDYSLPIHTASQAQQYVNWIVARYKDPVHTFSTIRWELPASFSNADALMAELLTRELSDMVTIQHQPLGGGAEINRNVWIRGIRHEFADSAWRATEFTVQDASWILGLAHYDVSTYAPAGTDVFSY